ncbi:MAG: hypothetical protein IT429_03955 [Gemmataceae bacterium]|nr:hypothetical protein [Gemmataceae bacterium]
MSHEPALTLPPAWQEILTRVEQALAAAVAAAARREDALSAAESPAEAHHPDLAGGLARFAERLHGLGLHGERAAHTVAEADGALAAGEDALRAWFQNAEAVRRKLAGWAGRP